MSFGLYPNGFKQRGDVISFGPLADDSGEGRDLIGGWQVGASERCLRLFQRREATVLD